jgi:cell division septation protein DedD
MSISSDIRSMANETVSGLRSQAQRTLHVEALRSTVEPYLAQARGYTHAATDRAEGLLTTALTTAQKDPRLARALDAAESVTTTFVDTVGTVVDAVGNRVVKPVQTLTGRGTTTPAAPAAETVSKPTATATTTATGKPAPAKTTGRSTSKPAGRSTAKSAGETTTAAKRAGKPATTRSASARKPAPKSNGT